MGAADERDATLVSPIAEGGAAAADRESDTLCTLDSRLSLTRSSVRGERPTVPRDTQGRVHFEIASSSPTP
jgi:hypothetical protein